MGRPKGKLSKGQPRGARSASGRKRDRTPQEAGPCEGVQRRRELYRLPANDVGEPDAKAREARKGKQETDTCDALGRAYCAGLLGSGRQAEDRLNAGRGLASSYWRSYGFSTPDSLARFQPQQGSAKEDPARDQRREESLNRCLNLINSAGRHVRFAFDQLVVDPNPDIGPVWLDAIVAAHRSSPPRPAPASALRQLEHALDGLDLIA